MKGIYLILLFLSIFLLFLFGSKNTKAESFNYNYLISDEAFSNKWSMKEIEVKDFLSQKGSVLADYTIPSGQPGEGRKAWAHIYSESQNYGINPQVILTILQKEQSLVTSSSASEYALTWAMGYGVYAGSPYMNPSDPNYTGGFGRQISKAAASLKDWFDKGLGPGGSKAGQNVSIQTRSSQEGYTSVNLSTRATAALYRYTPYIYNGNYNFWKLFTGWFVDFASEWITQNGYPTLMAGQSYNFSVSFKNLGNATWQKGMLNLGTSHPRDRISLFQREGDGPSGWIRPDRVTMQEESVAPGGTAHFSFWMKPTSSMATGTYREYFQLVADGRTWLEDYGVYWDINVISQADSYRSQWITQSGYPTLNYNQSHNFKVTFKNTGTSTWYKGQVNLGTSHPRDRISLFQREGDGPSGWLRPDRIEMQESSVPPGGEAHFSFWMKPVSSMATGTYREYFQLVADGITWMEDQGVYWDVTVR